VGARIAAMRSSPARIARSIYLAGSVAATATSNDQTRTSWLAGRTGAHSGTRGNQDDSTQISRTVHAIAGHFGGFLRLQELPHTGAGRAHHRSAFTGPGGANHRRRATCRGTRGCHLDGLTHSLRSTIRLRVPTGHDARATGETIGVFVVPNVEESHLLDAIFARRTRFIPPGKSAQSRVRTDTGSGRCRTLSPHA